MSTVSFASTPEFMPCVVYTRVSTDEQAKKDHNSCETQEGYCDGLIERFRKEGWVKKFSISDPGYTGSNLNRPGIRELVQLVKARQIRVLVVYRRDRLFRDTGDSNELQAFFDYHNVIVASVVEGIHDQAPHSRFARTMIDAMSEFERLTILGRVRDSVRAKASRGEWKGGYAPYGYSYTPGTNVPLVNQDEAPVVRFIFESIADGMTTRELCRLLREKGVYRNGARPNARGANVQRQIYFNTDQIRRMIQQPLYRGYLRARNPEAPENTDLNLVDSWQLFKGKHEAIVSEEVWLRANRLMKKPNSTRTLPKARSVGVPLSFLAGIARCAECQCAMTPSSARKRRKDGAQHRYLRCSRHLKAAEMSKCRTRSLAASAAESAIHSLINEIADPRSSITRLDAKDRFTRANEKIAKLKSELMDLESKIHVSAEKVQKVVDLLACGTYESLTPELLREIEKEKGIIKASQDARILVETEILRAGARMPTPEQLATVFRRIAVSIATADIETQAKIARDAFNFISIRRLEPNNPHGKRREHRLYRLTAQVATTRVMNFGVSDITRLTGFHRYSDLEFSVTIEVRSNATEQTVFVLETNYTVVSTTYAERPVEAPKLIDSENPIQRAFRWKELLAAGVKNIRTLAEQQEVSHGLVSQHLALLKLPPKILRFLKEGRAAALERPFTLRELQRVAVMPPDEAERYFLSRIARQSFQPELPLEDDVKGAGGEPSS